MSRALYLHSLGLERRPHSDETPCPECNGRGWFYTDCGPGGEQEACDECAGEGYVAADEDDLSLAPVTVLGIGRVAA